MFPEDAGRFKKSLTKQVGFVLRHEFGLRLRGVRRVQHGIGRRCAMRATECDPEKERKAISPFAAQETVGCVWRRAVKGGTAPAAASLSPIGAAFTSCFWPCVPRLAEKAASLPLFRHVGGNMNATANATNAMRLDGWGEPKRARVSKGLRFAALHGN